MAGLVRTQDLLWEARVERVRQGICETIAPFDLRLSDDQDCRVEPQILDLGMVRIMCASGSGLDGEVIRTPRLIRQSDPELCKIDLQLHGRTVVEQDDRQAVLGSGAFTFVDLSRPCQLVGGLAGVAAVMFPRSLLPLRHRDSKQLTGVAFHPQEPNSALVATLVGQVISRSDQYSAAAGARIGAAIVELIAAALSVRLDGPEAVPAGTQSQVLMWRVKTFIEDRLGDPDLSPSQIAAAHHISLRYLHRLFEAQQTTVGSWIRARRLVHCRRDLSDPTLLQRPVSAVGSRWGFVDATHFARAFKREYGVTPSEYRRMGALPAPDRSAV